jgi:hypothetical protein
LPNKCDIYLATLRLAEIAGVFASEGFPSGVTVAVGDVGGEVVVGTTPVASHVKAFDVATGATLLSFLALEGFGGTSTRP